MLGYNYRMTAIQAAIGLEQFKKLDKINDIRRKNADYLTKIINQIDGIEPPYVDLDVKHVYWVYGAKINKQKLGISRDQLAETLLAEGIQVEGYTPIPVHLQKAVKEKIGYGQVHCPYDCPFYEEKPIYKENICPNAETLSQMDLLLPTYPTLSEQDLTDISSALSKVISNIDSLISFYNKRN
jgi:dTDP-4-amino-4,6-dideoxygalactose transaminase